jgi:hypothetical protein
MQLFGAFVTSSPANVEAVKRINIRTLAMGHSSLWIKTKAKPLKGGDAKSPA